MDPKKSSIISIRLSPEDLQEIDAFVKRNSHYSRNMVIVCVLRSVFSSCDDQVIRKLIWNMDSESIVDALGK